MLDDQQILHDIHALPPEKQAEVLDFIAFVKTKIASKPTQKNSFQIRPTSEGSGFQNTSADHDAILAKLAQNPNQ